MRNPSFGFTSLRTWSRTGSREESVADECPAAWQCLAIHWYGANSLHLHLKVAFDGLNACQRRAEMAVVKYPGVPQVSDPDVNIKWDGRCVRATVKETSRGQQQT